MALRFVAALLASCAARISSPPLLHNEGGTPPTFVELFATEPDRYCPLHRDVSVMCCTHVNGCEFGAVKPLYGITCWCLHR